MRDRLNKKQRTDLKNDMIRAQINQVVKKLEGERFTRQHIQQQMKLTFNVHVSASKLRQVLRNDLNYSWKKSERNLKTTEPSDTETQNKFIKLMQVLINTGCWFVYIDESAVKYNAHQNYTWVSKQSPVRLKADKPAKTVSLISAITSHGDSFNVLRHGTNRAIEFHNFIVLLLKELQKLTYGKRHSKMVIIIDNAGIHKVDKVQTLFRRKKLMVVTLPPYSPWFNPIEHYFRALKLRISRNYWDKPLPLKLVLGIREMSQRNVRSIVDHVFRH